MDNVLGLRAGDVARTVGFQKQLGIPPVQVLSTLIIERLLGLATLLVLFFAAMGGVRPGAFPAVFVSAGYWIVSVCLTLLLLLLFAPARLMKLADSIGRLATARGWLFLPRVAGWASEFFNSLSLIRSFGLVLRLLALSLVIWVIEGTVFYLVGRSLSIEEGNAWPWFALSTGTLATLFPSAPGSIGTFDYFAVLGVVSFGVPRAKAVVFALLVHIMIWFPTTLTGLGWLAIPAGWLSMRGRALRSPATVTADDGK
jgi:uncharacterized protein (TIRG00374 family)